jgi:hypothetical protein
MHDQELLRRAQYDQDNGLPDDLYVIPAAHTTSASTGAVNDFPAFSRRLRTIRYPKDFKPAIEKYDSRSDPSIWLKMYRIAARASGGNEDHMDRYFPPLMGKAPLLWLDNLPAECITSWPTLSRLFATNYQATYNRPGNTHHFTRVRMRSDETLESTLSATSRTATPLQVSKTMTSLPTTKMESPTSNYSRRCTKPKPKPLATSWPTSTN